MVHVRAKAAGALAGVPVLVAGGLALTVQPAAADITLGCGSGAWGSVCAATSGQPPDGPTIHGLYSVITNVNGPAPSIVVRGCSQVFYVDFSNAKERCGAFTEVPNGAVLITGLYEHTDFTEPPGGPNGARPWLVRVFAENAFGVAVNELGSTIVPLCQGSACPPPPQSFDQKPATAA